MVLAPIARASQGGDDVVDARAHRGRRGQDRPGHRRVLTAERFSTDIAEDGVAALALAGERDYDVILLDRMLPDLDGMEVLRLLRSRGVGRRCSC